MKCETVTDSAMMDYCVTHKQDVADCRLERISELEQELQALREAAKLTEPQLEQVANCVSLVIAGGPGDFMDGGLGNLTDWNTLGRAAEALGVFGWVEG